MAVAVAFPQHCIELVDCHSCIAIPALVVMAIASQLAGKVGMVAGKNPFIIPEHFVILKHPRDFGPFAPSSLPAYARIYG